MCVCELLMLTQWLFLTHSLHPGLHQLAQDPLLMERENLLDHTSRTQLRDCREHSEGQTRAHLEEGLEKVSDSTAATE